jgi:hypothetical protein
MNQRAYTVLRIGLGITFIWIAALIWREPELWASFMPISLQDSLPILAGTFMKGVAVMDFLIGLLLVLNVYTWIVAGLAVLHLFGLVFMLGLGDLSARDFGLLTAALAVFIHARSAKEKSSGSIPIQS